MRHFDRGGTLGDFQRGTAEAATAAAHFADRGVRILQRAEPLFGQHATRGGELILIGRFSG